MAANVLEIEKTIAAYLRQDVSDFTVNGVNLLRNACNNARKAAERIHDWEFTHVKAKVTTGSTGVGNLNDAVLVSDDSAVKIKQVITYYLAEGDWKIPLYHQGVKHAAVRSRDWMDRRGVGYGERYLSDDTLISPSNIRGLRHEVIMQGTQFHLVPATTEAKVIHLDAFKWLSDYSADTDVDHFVTHGADYLIYAGIVECNMFNTRFSENQEGNLGPPTRARDEALQGLLEADNFYIEGGRTPR